METDIYILLLGLGIGRMFLYFASHYNDVAWWGNTVLSELTSVAFLVWFVFYVPASRMESLLCISACGLWSGIRHLQFQIRLTTLRQFEGRVQFERVVLNYLAQLKLRPPDEQLAQASERLADAVGIGDERIAENGRLEPLLKQPTLQQFQHALEQGWADSLVLLSQVSWTDTVWSISQTLRWAILILALLQLPQ